MKRNLQSINSVLAGLLIAVLFFLSSAGEAHAIISNNDAGIVTTLTPLTIPNYGVCVINQTFSDGTLPQPAGILGTSAGTQDGRLFRDGIPSTCSLTSPFLVSNAGYTRHYEYYTFLAARTGCLNITSQTDNELYVAVYSGSYNPANYIVNGIGQGGFSGPTSFACPVVAAQTYVLVVMDVTGTGAGVNYSISLDNVSGVAVPISIWWILAAFVLIGGFTVYKFRLRRA
jgi:hypothetical protein